MKRLVVGLVGALILGMAGMASALPFSSVVDFSGSGTDSGRTYLKINDDGTNFVGAYTHNVSFIPDAAQITSASLTLDYARASQSNPQGPQELWLFYEGTTTQKGITTPPGTTYLGTLTGPDDNTWQTKTFILSTTLFENIIGATWTIGFKFNENTGDGNTDHFWLDKSTLFGEYTPVEVAPVPEPGTIVLLGAGLVGLSIYGRRRMNK